MTGAHTRVTLVKGPFRWFYHIDSYGTLKYTSKKYWFKFQAELEARFVARTLKARYIGR